MAINQDFKGKPTDNARIGITVYRGEQAGKSGANFVPHKRSSEAGFTEQGGELLKAFRSDRRKKATLSLGTVRVAVQAEEKVEESEIKRTKGRFGTVVYTLVVIGGGSSGDGGTTNEEDPDKFFESFTAWDLTPTHHLFYSSNSYGLVDLMFVYPAGEVYTETFNTLDITPNGIQPEFGGEGFFGDPHIEIAGKYAVDTFNVSTFYYNEFEINYTTLNVG